MIDRRSIIQGLLLGLVVAPISGATSLLAAPPAAERTPASERVIFTNAKIHVGDGTVIDGGSILIEAGKITRIERTAITGVAGALSVDLAGKLVTPGLIAADTEIGVVEVGLEDSTHDDSRRDASPIKAGYDPGAAINADSSVIAVQAIEGVTTAAVAPRGGLLSGGVAWIDLIPGAHASIVAASGVAVVGNLGRSHDGSRAAALAQLRRTFEDARWYRQNERNYERNQAQPLSAHPFDLRALWPVLDKKIPLVVRAHRASDLLALIELAAELGIELTIVGASEGWKVAAELAAADVTLIQLDLLVAERLYGAAPGGAVTVSVREGDAGYPSIKSSESRMLKAPFVVFVKWYEDDIGQVFPHWHLSPDTESVRSMVATRVDLLHGTPTSGR
jgi:imidazolonepropionase-like amidohydrolase